jgi:hypothetical protein
VRLVSSAAGSCHSGPHPICSVGPLDQADALYACQVSPEKRLQGPVKVAATLSLYSCHYTNKSKPKIISKF